MVKEIKNPETDISAIMMSIIYTFVMIFILILFSPPAKSSSNVIPQVIFFNVSARVMLIILTINNFKGFYNNKTNYTKEKSIKNSLKELMYTLLMLVIFMGLFISDPYLYDRIGYDFLYYALPSTIIAGIWTLIRFLKIRNQILSSINSEIH